MAGQTPIEVIQFGPNPRVSPEHPNEVSLTLDDAIEMVKVTYGDEVEMEVVQDESGRGKIFLSLAVVLPHYLKQRSQRSSPVQTKPEYHALVAQLIGKHNEQEYLDTTQVFVNRAGITPA